MLLYEYTKSCGKDIILNSRLKVSEHRHFNDPFEMSLQLKKIRGTDIKKYIFKNKNKLRDIYNKGQFNQTWKEFRRENSNPIKRDERAKIIASEANNDWKQIFNPQRGSTADYFLICCFCAAPTKTIDEILMWSHYTDGHEGLRYWLESELLPKNIGVLDKIEYEDQIVSSDPIGFLTGKTDLTQKAIIKSLRVKSKAWEYEREYRWFVSKEFCKIDLEKNEYFVYIDLNAIKRIDFGVKISTNTIKEVTKKVKDLGLKTEFKKTVMDEREFKFNYVDI